MTSHHHYHTIRLGQSQDHCECAATLALLAVSCNTKGTTSAATQSAADPHKTRGSITSKLGKLDEKLAELARERECLSQMVEAEARRFGTIFARTEARIVANRQAATELHHSSTTTTTTNVRSRDQAKRHQPTKGRQPTPKLKSLCELLGGAKEEEEDEQASQQTGSVTPKAMRYAGSTSKRSQPAALVGDEGLLEEGKGEGACRSEGEEIEEGDDAGDVEYQDDPEEGEEDDDDDDDGEWALLAEEEEQQGSRSLSSRHEGSPKLAGSTAERPKLLKLGGRRAGKRNSSAGKRAKFDANWDKRYALLVDYFGQYGNAHIPQKWRPDPTLGKWASNQRYLLAKQRLPESRYARLELLGFWDTKFTSYSRSSSSSSRAKR